MFSGNQQPTKKRTPHGSFSRSSQIPIPTTSTSNSTSLNNNQTNLNLQGDNDPEEIEVASSTINNNHAPSTSTSTSIAERRISTQSNQVSYAYGAPSNLSNQPQLQSRASPARSINSRSNNNINNNNIESNGEALSAREESVGLEAIQSETGASGSNITGGKALEPAVVRYGRIKQRNKDLGRPFVEENMIEQDDSTISVSNDKKKVEPVVSELQPVVEIEITNRRKTSTIGNRSSLNIVESNNSVSSRPITGRSYPNGTSVNIATAFTQALENNTSGVGIGGNSKSKELERDTSMSAEEDEQSGKDTQNTSTVSKKRKKRTSDEGNVKLLAREVESDQELEEGLARSKAKRSKKDTSVDTQVEEQAQAPPIKQTSPSSRRKTGDTNYKPSGNSDVEISSSASSDDDSRTKRRRSKGKGRASTTSSQAIPIGRRDGDVWMGKKKKGGKRGGRKSLDSERGSSAQTESGQEVDENGEMGGFDGEYQEEALPPSTSYYLRPKSPSLSNSPQPEDSNRFNFNSNQQDNMIDPTFAAFDRSLNDSSFGGGGRESSLDESGIRGSSYDYSEEERIVVAIEAEKERERKASKKNAANTSSTSTSGMRKRRNRIPSPPNLQAMEPIEEEDLLEDNALPNEGIGRKLGSLVRPVIGVSRTIWRNLKNPLLDWWKIWRAIGLTLTGLFIVSLIIRQPTNSLESITNKSIIDYFPFLSKSFNYSPPEIAPESLDILVERLSHLERMMGELASRSESDRLKSKQDRKRIGQITNQFLELETLVEVDKKQSSKVIEELESNNSKESKEVEKVIQEVKSDLSTLVSRIKSLSEERTIDGTIIEELKSGVQSVGKEVASLTNQVSQISKDIQAGMEVERITKIALEAIESHLPSKLVVRMDSNGKLELDPQFWKYLKDAFTEKKDLDSIIKSQVDTKVKSEVKSEVDSELKLRVKAEVKSEVETRVESKVKLEIAKLPKSSSPPVTILKQPTWSDFLSTNEESIKSLIESDVKGRLNSDAIISKKAFLDILHREIKKLKIDFESKSNENVEKIGQELLNKVAKQEQMRLDNLPPPPVSTPSVVLKSTDGQNISAIVTSLVDSALLKYSKDILAKPDYALSSSGGRIIPSLTSPTYTVQPLGLAPQFLGWLTGTGTTPGRPPVTALHPYNSPGYCWPFNGSNGQLGILLSRVIVPTEIVLEHISKDLAIEGEVGSAPRDFEVWGVVEGKENVDKLKDFREELLLAKKKKLEENSDLLNDDEEEEPATSLPPSSSHLLLAIGSYDINSNSPIQSFPVTTIARQLNLPIGVVIIKILSNHGEIHYTCLYRVRVGGVSLGQKIEVSGE